MIKMLILLKISVGTGPTMQMLALQDALSISALGFMTLAAFTNSSLITILAGLVLGMSTRFLWSFFTPRLMF